uniref:sodium/glutamate symporter n=1 Tax=Fusobacterium sp. TaxID=68766 RepID=UPI002621CF84
SLFLLIGVVLRAKVKILQNLFLPSSVIGGFLLLMLPLPKEYINIYSKIPGTLIVPIVASIPLGLTISNNKERLKTVLPHGLIMMGVTMAQIIVGIVSYLLFKNIIPNLYPIFGAELEFAFAGGHGTIGMLSNMLKDKNLPYWDISQGVGSAIATFGLVGGILFGMLIINIGARKRMCGYIEKPENIPESLKTGYERDITKQSFIGRETTLSTSVDTLAFHGALILSVTALAYFIFNFVKAHNIMYFKSIAVWTYAIFLMFLVWYVMCKLNLNYLVDSKVKARFSGMLTEYAIVSAIASMPLKVIAQYIVPIIFVSLLGFLVTFLYIFILSKIYIKDDWFEHSIISFGMNTGIFITGLLLLRVTDPELKSSAFADHTLCYAMTSWSFVIVGILLDVWISKGAIVALISTFVMLCFFTVLLPLTARKTMKP